jgi:LAS superfamily LD-carboxypeptidase LdcB
MGAASHDRCYRGFRARGHLVLRSDYDAWVMRRRSPAAALLVAALVATLLSLVQPAGAAQSSVDRLRQQRREVQRQRAAAASSINVLQASAGELADALDAVQANRDATAAALASARQQSAALSAKAAEARAKLEATTAELTDLRGTVRRMAVEEYMRGGTPEDEVDVDPNSPMESERRRSLLSAAVGRSSDVADRLRQAQEDQELERVAAQQAAEQAAAEQRRVEEELAVLEADAARQEKLAAQAEAKLERALSEADALSSVDSRLANQIASEQAALASRLRTVPRSGGGSSSGTTRRAGNVTLTTVRGITVASSIAGNLESLLAAADADGITFGGGGYRDSQQQIATRRRNCGSSDYDVYEKPASSCRPPTARPGSSLHEQGLAIDFTQGGSTLTRGSSGYQWLKANAGRFGFKNLPSEPWHWSTTGD